jgi:putative transposase
MSLNKNTYRRKLSRLQNWDYSWNGKYFITINTKNRISYFGEIENGKMILNEIGEFANKFWHEIPKHFEYVKLGNFIVMPNHVHGIIIIDKPNNCGGSDRDNACIVPAEINPPPTRIETENDIEILIRKTIGQLRCQNQGKNTISSIVGSYKSVVSKNAHVLNPNFAWQSRFWDHIICNRESYNNIQNYIKNNPKNWEKDTFNNKYSKTNI